MSVRKIITVAANSASELDSKVNKILEAQYGRPVHVDISFTVLPMDLTGGMFYAHLKESDKP